MPSNFSLSEKNLFHQTQILHLEARSFCKKPWFLHGKNHVNGSIFGLTFLSPTFIILFSVSSYVCVSSVPKVIN